MYEHIEEYTSFMLPSVTRILHAQNDINTLTIDLATLIGLCIGGCDADILPVHMKYNLEWATPFNSSTPPNSEAPGYN